MFDPTLIPEALTTPTSDFIYDGPGHWHFQLYKDFSVELFGFRFREYKGWPYDMATSPRWAWPFISPLDLGDLTIFVHDIVTERRGYIDGDRISHLDGSKERISKVDCDRMFQILATREQCIPWKVKAAHMGIRFKHPDWVDYME